MQGIFNKLASYAALVGVIGAIGGGFMAWGEFSNRIAQLEGQDFVITQTVDLTDTHDRIVLGDKETMDAVRSIAAALEAIKGDIAINDAAIKFLDAKIEELKAEMSNPLL